jgi:ribonuclease T2
VKRYAPEFHSLYVKEKRSDMALPFRFPQHTWRLLAVAALISLSVAFSLEARSSRKHPVQSAGAFSYYMLVLSYAPDFCAEPGGTKDARECGKGRHVGFVVHGLWPQAESSRGPENCGSARPVSQDIVNATLPYIPTPSLIQHEWTAHGTCSGLDAGSYFALVRRARDSVKIPGELNQPTAQVKFSPADVESKMAGVNSSFAKDSFRVSCYRDNNLQEVRVCLNKDLSSRACTVSAGECAANTVTLQPVR